MSRPKEADRRANRANGLNIRTYAITTGVYAKVGGPEIVANSGQGLRCPPYGPLFGSGRRGTRGGTTLQLLGSHGQDNSSLPGPVMARLPNIHVGGDDLWVRRATRTREENGTNQDPSGHRRAQRRPALHIGASLLTKGLPAGQNTKAITAPTACTSGAIKSIPVCMVNAVGLRSVPVAHSALGIESVLTIVLHVVSSLGIRNLQTLRRLPLC